MTQASPKRATAALSALLAALLCGCGGVSVNLPGPGEQPRAAAPAPSARSRSGKTGRARASEDAAIAKALRRIDSGKAGYRIGPADLLEIKVFREEELERVVRVTPNGTITFPLIGQVKLGGLDVAGAERLLVERLKKYIIDPQVSIFITEYGNKLVYVLGEVQKPGSYSLPTEAPLTVLEAVTLAGGFTPYAALDRTRVIRKGQGRSQSFQIEITAITKDGDKSKDIVLMPNDVVFVPESFF